MTTINERPGLNAMVARYFDRVSDPRCSICDYLITDPRDEGAPQVHVDGLRDGDVTSVSHVDC
ncbi:MAG: hypothetical protein ACREJC_03830 [Tepidisphaeraceae bacterium]